MSTTIRQFPLKTQTKYWFILFLILISIKPLESSCPNNILLTNTACFNNIITFRKRFRAGRYATNKNGDMIIEYSNDNEANKYERLFFGLKKNGRGFFPDENTQRERNAKYFDNAYGRYESRNMFVCLTDDINRNKEYLFSTSTYNSLTELFDLENNKYTSKPTRTIFNTLDIFSYEFSLIELKQSNQLVYFIAFTEHETDKKDNKDYSKKFKVLKFKFTSFDLSSGYTQLAEYIDWNNYNDRIVSAFLLENHNLLAVFLLKEVKSNNPYTYDYYIHYFDYDLKDQGEYELYKTGKGYYDIENMSFMESEIIMMI